MIHLRPSNSADPSRRLSEDRKRNIAIRGIALRLEVLYIVSTLS